jgi:hypothetical protein
MAKGQVTRRQKDISRVIRARKAIPPPKKAWKAVKDAKR